jgi:hypothetical protein
MMNRAVLITAGILLAVAAGHHHYQQQEEAKAKAARRARYQAAVKECVQRRGGLQVWTGYQEGDRPGNPTGWNSTTWECAGEVIKRGY